MSCSCFVSCELGVASWELRVTGKKCELGPLKCEFRVPLKNFKFPSFVAKKLVQNQEFCRRVS